MNLRQVMTTHVAVDKKVALYAAILGLPLLLGFLGSAVEGWPAVLDDAFITYRYARNLAHGHGITWNPGGAPTEGYTNFLLVVLLAPFLKLGADPLVVTRALSYLSAAAIAASLFVIAKRRYGCRTTVAMPIAALILFVPETRKLCLLGLETVIYSLVLLLAFHAGVVLIESRTKSRALLFALLLCLAALLRPEATLLFPLVLLLYARRLRQSQNLREASKPLALALLVVVAIGGAYLLWKHLHFGSLLPSPFHLKVQGGTWLSSRGTQSVLSFLLGNSLIVALSGVGLLLCSSEDQRPWSSGKLPAVLGLGMAFLYACFFLHADTLMDREGRFLFPLLPVLIYVSLPALGQALSVLESRTGERWLAVLGLILTFVIAFGARDLFGLVENARRIVPEDERKPDYALAQRELEVAKALSGFPGITRVRIAVGDAGVIPYFTDAVCLDVVGLNDALIARTRERSVLLDHFFGFEADLVIHPGRAGRGWITNGHGPLGNFASWAPDPRWDAYRYVGTVITDIYDLQFFVRASSANHQALSAFLRNHVVDGWYDASPLAIGTSRPHPGRLALWTPRAR